MWGGGEQSAKAACVSASEAARAVEAATHAGDIVQALYKTSIAASRAATVRLRPTATGVNFVDAHVQLQTCMFGTCPLRGASPAGFVFSLAPGPKVGDTRLHYQRYRTR